MSHLISLGQCLRSLQKTFDRAIQQAQRHKQPVLVGASFSMSSIDPLHILGAWDDGETPYFYWESREPDTAFFAWGCAHVLTASGELRFLQIDKDWGTFCKNAVINGPIAPRLCGGFRFDPQGPHQTHWHAFDDASLVLPNITVLKKPDGYWTLCQHVVNGNDDHLTLAAHYCAALWRLRQPLETRKKTDGQNAFMAVDAAHRRLWEDKVAEAVQHIRQGHFSKVVLARSQCQASGNVSPWRVIQHLRQQHRDSHLFACRRGTSCFLGASPERLAYVKDGMLNTHALAGTTARGRTTREDDILGQALLDNPKERHEHDLVVEAIRHALQPYCKDLSIPSVPMVKRLSRIQHLHTPIHARLNDDISLLNVLQTLHPTPAVGGYPRVEAMAYIRQHEGQDRGWYAAPLGWLDSDGNGDFIVALRSALISQGKSYLFAGCGLVESSSPAQEYEETCLKLSTMEAALLFASKIGFFEPIHEYEINSGRDATGR